MAGDQLGLVRLDGVEGVGAEQLGDVVVGVTRSMASHPPPDVGQAGRMRFRPTRIRLFTVPSGSPSAVPPRDRSARRSRPAGWPALVLGQGGHRLLDPVRHGQVPHLVLDVVARLGGLAAPRAPPAGAGTCWTGAGRRPARGPGPAGTSAAIPARDRSGPAGPTGGGTPPGRSPRPGTGRRAPGGPARTPRRHGAGRPRRGRPPASDRSRRRGRRRWRRSTKGA